MKMIAKRFSSTSAGVLLEKVIRKITQCSGTKRLWGYSSLVKLHGVQLKKNFSIYFFLENFEKWPEKKQKLSEKLLTGLVSMNIFYRYVLKVDKTYLQISFKTIFFKMSNPLEQFVIFNLWKVPWNWIAFIKLFCYIT